MAGAETSAAYHRNFRHDAVRDGVHHFCACADDSAPLRLFANHESVDVVQKNERHKILVAVHDKTRGLFRRFGIDYSAKLDAPRAGRGVYGGDMLLVVRDDADGPAANPGVAAHHGLAVFGAILLEFAPVDDS